MQKQKTQKQKTVFTPGDNSTYAKKPDRMYGKGCCAHKVTDERLRANRKAVRESGHLEQPLGLAAYSASWRWSKPTSVQAFIESIMDRAPRAVSLPLN
jgi:hypothetical protein